MLTPLLENLSFPVRVANQNAKKIFLKILKKMFLLYESENVVVLKLLQNKSTKLFTDGL